MFIVFFVSQAWFGPLLADTLVGWLESFQGWVSGLLENSAGELDVWGSILVDGIIGGVIAVIGFLPLVMVMYFLIALLEDCGYMARVSVVLDPIFKKVGLSGKSVIPFVIGTGCAVPGVMACRTIRNERERRATAMLAPFMPCGAKLPVIALFAGVFFADSPWVGPLMYFCGILIILGCAVLVNLLTGYKNKKSYFIMELPEYKAPGLWKACKSMLSRGWAYIVKAGTIILVCNFAVHLMQNFDWNFNVVSEENANSSILATISSPFAYIIAPIVGVVAWQLAAATVTGFIAKENVVGTLAICFALTNFISVDVGGLIVVKNVVEQTFGITKVAALSYLMFNLFTPPCFAAIGAMNSEMKSRKWLWGGIALQFGTGYTVAFLVYQIGTLITTGAFGAGLVPGFVAVLVMIAILMYIIKKSEKTFDAKYALKKNA